MRCWSFITPVLGQRDTPDRTHAAKVRACFAADLSVYAVHLPLDRHPEVGNNVLLAGALGGVVDGEFGQSVACRSARWRAWRRRAISAPWPGGLQRPAAVSPSFGRLARIRSTGSPSLRGRV